MLAPWFQVTGETTAGRIVSYTLTGFGSFGWVETALLLVCGGIVWMLFARGENRAFHLPGGDGSIVTFGGIWCLGLLVWRILFNKPHPTLGTETGIDWGVMAALAAATLMLGAGLRLKAEHLAEPPIIFPEDRDTGQLTLDGSPSKPVIPAPESDPEPADDVDPTIAQLTMQLPDEPRRRRRTRRRPQD